MQKNIFDSKTLSASEQTRLTWANFIHDYEHIPSIYNIAFSSHFKPTGEFPYILLAPAFAGFLRPTYEKLVCCSKHAVTIFEKRPEQIRYTSFAYDSISYVETGTVLLNSWLTIFGIDHQGQSGATTIKFNTVGDELFRPIFSNIRASADYSLGSQLNVEKNSFDFLSVLNFKFMNYGRRSLRPGDKVLRVILQPELRKEILTVFGRSFSQFSFPAHLLILTNNEIISIRDASKIAEYGGIWNYIPRRKINSVSLKEEENHRIMLCLGLPGNTKVDIPFDISQMTVVETLRDEIWAGLPVPTLE